jgi:hypothetical protein
MSIFRKASNAFKGAGDIFKKISNPVQSIFRKGGIVERGLDGASGGLGKASSVLNQINAQAGKVLDSDIATNIANLAGPSGMNALNGIRAGNRIVGVGGNLAGQGSQLTNRRNYSGSSGDVVNNILERSKKIGETGSDAFA